MSKATVSTTRLSREAEEALVARYQAGERSATAPVLLKAHEGIIRKFVRWCAWSTVDPDDLFQEGSLGLFRAVDRFDPKRGHRLITLAVWWIRASVKEAARRGAIRVPPNVQDVMLSLQREGVDVGDVDALLEAEAFSSAQVATSVIATWGYVPLSLDAPAHNHTDGSKSGTVGEKLASDEATPEEALAQAEAVAKRSTFVQQLLGALTSRELDTIKRRFLAEEPETLMEIGHSYKRTRERVRQIETRALRRLRARATTLGVSDDE